MKFCLFFRSELLIMFVKIFTYFEHSGKFSSISLNIQIFAKKNFLTEFFVNPIYTSCNSKLKCAI